VEKEKTGKLVETTFRSEDHIPEARKRVETGVSTPRFQTALQA